MKRMLGLLLFLPVLAWGQQAFTGKWKANLQNAKFSQKPDQVLLQEGRFQCSTCSPKLDVKADGADQPVSGSGFFDAIAVKLVDERSVQLTYRQAGKIVAEGTRTVAADGNTLTQQVKAYPPNREPIITTVTMARLEPAPAGAHAISGSWVISKAENNSASSGLDVEFEAGPDHLSMRAPNGEAYDARFDGNDYPIRGDRDGTTVSLKKVNDRAVEETIKVGGKVVAVNLMTVSADGKTLNVEASNKDRGTTMSWSAQKQ